MSAIERRTSPDGLLGLRHDVEPLEVGRADLTSGFLARIEVSPGSGSPVSDAAAVDLTAGEIEGPHPGGSRRTAALWWTDRDSPADAMLRASRGSGRQRPRRSWARRLASKWQALMTPVAIGRDVDRDHLPLTLDALTRREADHLVAVGGHGAAENDPVGAELGRVLAAVPRLPLGFIAEMNATSR